MAALESTRRKRATLARGASHVRSERGVAVVEFALLLVPLLLIIFGIVDFGRAMNYKNELTQVANQAARFAVVNRNPADGTTPFPGCSGLKSYLSNPANVDTKEIADLIDAGTVQITAGATVGDPVTVRVTVDFNVIPFLGSGAFGIGQPSMSLAGQATMRLEQVPSFGSASC